MRRGGSPRPAVRARSPTTRAGADRDAQGAAYETNDHSRQFLAAQLGKRGCGRRADYSSQGPGRQAGRGLPKAATARKDRARGGFGETGAYSLTGP